MFFVLFFVFFFLNLSVCSHGGKAIRLTFDHKGSEEGEVKRIQEAGGFVVMNRVNGMSHIFVFSLPLLQENF